MKSVFLFHFRQNVSLFLCPKKQESKSLLLKYNLNIYKNIKFASENYLEIANNINQYQNGNRQFYSGS